MIFQCDVLLNYRSGVEILGMVLTTQKAQTETGEFLEPPGATIHVQRHDLSNVIL